MRGRTVVLIGVGLVAAAVGFAMHTEKFVERAQVGKGTVVRIDSLPATQGGSSYHPVFRFTGSDGRTYTVVSGSGSNPAGFEVGEAVRVVYEANDPMGAKIDSFNEVWGGPLFLGGLGLLMMFLGVLVARKERRSRFGM